MSRTPGRPVGWREALLSHLMVPLRRAWLALPAADASPREQAFRRYRFEVRRVLRREPVAFTVLANRTMAAGGDSKVVELSLRAPVPVAPADLLYLWWRNAPEVAAAQAASQVPALAWSTPLPYRPARLQRYERTRFLMEVIDLGEPPATPLRRSPRIVPRLYTVSHAAEGEVRLQVTWRADWPQRAAAFLHRLAPGEQLSGWVFPHPHRIPPDGEGVAIVTGSGAAAVFAALRAGRSGVHLVWGLGEKVPAPWVLEELEALRQAGRLTGLRLVASPQRVTELIPELGQELRQALEEGWVFIAGHEAMGRDADGIIRQQVGDGARNRAAADLRYIVST